MTNELALLAVDEAQQAILTQTTPDHAIKTRIGRGGKTLSYVSHDWVTRQLNNAFNWQWSFEIKSYLLLPPENPIEVIVNGRLTVITPKGNLTKEQFGGSDIKRTKNGDIISVADDLKAAASDCLKKCASLLGLALDLYGDTPTEEEVAAKAALKTNGNAPTSAPELLKLINGRVQVPYDNLTFMLNGIRQSLGEKWNWPKPDDRQGWRDAYKAAKDYADGKTQPVGK